MRSLAAEEDVVPQRDDLLLLGLVELGRELHAARLARHIGRDRAEVFDRLAAARIRAG